MVGDIEFVVLAAFALFRFFFRGSGGVGVLEELDVPFLVVVEVSTEFTGLLDGVEDDVVEVEFRRELVVLLFPSWLIGEGCEVTASGSTGSYGLIMIRRSGTWSA